MNQRKILLQVEGECAIYLTERQLSMLYDGVAYFIEISSEPNYQGIYTTEENIKLQTLMSIVKPQDTDE